MQHSHVYAALSGLPQFLEQARKAAARSRARADGRPYMHVLEIGGSNPNTRLYGSNASFDYLIDVLSVA
jgi:hypothetical protein